MNKEDEVLSKQDRQKNFIDMCHEEKLSPQEIIEKASVFPVDEKSKVLKWPKL